MTQKVLRQVSSVTTSCFLLAILAMPVFAQSPAFPNTQPIGQEVFRDFPFHRFDGPGAPAFPPEVIIYFVPRTMPGDYPQTRGYGSSPYVRVYGGAGSS